MARFRNKPIVIEAVRVSDALAFAEHSFKSLPKWLQDAYDKGDILFAPEAAYIQMLKGEMTAWPDDWIIRGVKGELYPCKPDIFEATYEAVDESMCSAEMSQ